MPAPDLARQRAVATELLALTLIADGRLATAELDAIERYGIAALLGIAQDALVEAVLAHCHRLLEQGGHGRPLRLVDIERFEAQLDRITDTHLREVVCRAMLVLTKADGEISYPEQTLLRDAITRWSVSLDGMRAEDAAQAARAASARL